MNYEIVQAEYAHAETLAKRLRLADANEVRVITGMDSLTALLMSLSLSSEAYTWLADGEPVAMFGVAPIVDAPGTAAPWFLGDERVVRGRKYFLKNSRRFAARWRRQFPLLENYVHPDNKLSIRYLKWCGFEFGEPEPFGVNGELCLPFYLETSRV